MVTFDKRLQEELKQQEQKEQDKPATIETTKINSLKQVLQWIGKPAIIKACMSIILLIVTVVLILIADKFIIEFCALKITQFVASSKNIVVCLLALFCGTILTFGMTVLGSICIVVKVANFVMDGPLCVVKNKMLDDDYCINDDVIDCPVQVKDWLMGRILKNELYIVLNKKDKAIELLNNNRNYSHCFDTDIDSTDKTSFEYQFKYFADQLKNGEMYKIADIITDKAVKR